MSAECRFNKRDSFFFLPPFSREIPIDHPLPVPFLPSSPFQHPPVIRADRNFPSADEYYRRNDPRLPQAQHRRMLFAVTIAIITGIITIVIRRRATPAEYRISGFYLWNTKENKKRVKNYYVGIHVLGV